MAVIYSKDIIGYLDNTKLFCTECFDDKDKILMNDIFTESDKDKGKLYFCDECGRQL